MKTKWNKKRIIAAGVGTFLLASLLTLQFIPQQYVFRAMQHYNLLVPSAHGTDITQLVGLTGNIGKEDVEWGSGLATDTFTVPSSTSGTVTLTKVPSLFANIASLIKGKWYVTTDTVANHADNTINGSLAWIVTQLAGATATIELTPGTYTFAGDYTFPTTVALDSQFGSTIVATAHVVTINGPFRCGRWKAFTAAADEIVISFKSVETLYPEWWGAVGNATGVAGAGTDDTAAMTAALTCWLKHVKRIMLTGFYRITSPMAFTESVGGEFARAQMMGMYRGRWAVQAYEDQSEFYSSLFWDPGTATGDMLKITGYLATQKVRSINFSGIGFIGDEATDSAYALLSMKWLADASFEYVRFAKHKGIGLDLEDPADITITNCNFNRNGNNSPTRKGSLYVHGADFTEEGWSGTYRRSNGIWITQCRFEGDLHTPVWLEGATETCDIYQVYMDNCKVHGRSGSEIETGPAMYLKNISKSMFNNIYFAAQNPRDCVQVVGGFDIAFDGCMIASSWKAFDIDDGATTGKGSTVRISNTKNTSIRHSAITSISRAADAVIEFPEVHGLVVDDFVHFMEITGAEWSTGLNVYPAGSWQVTATPTTTTITVKNVLSGDALDTSGFALAYVPATNNGSIYYNDISIETNSHVIVHSISHHGHDGKNIPWVWPGKIDGELHCSHLGTSGWNFVSVANGVFGTDDSNYATDLSLYGTITTIKPSGFKSVSSRQPGDDHGRVALTSSGYVAFGSGAATQDCELRRFGVGISGVAAGTSWKMPGFAVAGPASSGYLIINANATDYYLWVDNAGKLRILNAAPANHDDGTVVGDQVP